MARLSGQGRRIILGLKNKPHNDRKNKREKRSLLEDRNTCERCMYLQVSVFGKERGKRDLDPLYKGGTSVM